MLSYRFFIFIFTLPFANIFCPLRLFLYSLFLFFFLSSFPFPPYFPLSFSFSQLASFPQCVLPFPKSAAPVLPHFLLPCYIQMKMSITVGWCHGEVPWLWWQVQRTPGRLWLMDVHVKRLTVVNGSKFVLYVGRKRTCRRWQLVGVNWCTWGDDQI